jgi:hypothetical protein
MDWEIVVGMIALLFSIACFYLFVVEATRKPVPEKVVEQAAMRAQATNLSPAAIGALVKALADAFSKVGPAALALIGAILFLLLGGEALRVFHLTDGGAKECAAKPGCKPTGETDDARGGPATDNGSSDNAQTGNVQ